MGAEGHFVSIVRAVCIHVILTNMPGIPANPTDPHLFRSHDDGSPVTGTSRVLAGARSFLIRPTGSVPGGSGFEGSRYLAKWLVLGSVVGVVAGLGAVVFSRAIEFATDLFLGTIVGYHPPAPVGEGEFVFDSMDRPWLLPLVVALGGLISGLIVWRFAPEAKGHGTDAAIAALHHKSGRLRGRVVPVKLVSSAITIGSGGSAGREGPAAQISAGFASLLAGWLRLSAADRRLIVAAGIGAGIGAIFRAPLGGAIMAAEILYIHDLEVEGIIPGLIASIVGYSVYGSISGWEPIFGAQPELGFEHPATLVYYALLGVICGIGGLMYAKLFYGTEHVFERLRLPVWLKPALGGLLVGLIGLKVQGAIHTGYGWVQRGMTEDLLTMPLWIVLVLPFAKMLATSLSIGSGGSGGIFGPGMVIGGSFGMAFWRLGHDVLPQFPSTPATFVIVGMMALFGGIAHAPLAMMLMVAEMTGNLSLLAPAMVAVALSTALVGDETIYRSQLPDRASSPMHRIRFSFPLLTSLRVGDAARPLTPDSPASTGELVLRDDETLDVALEQLSESGQASAAVSSDGKVVASLSVRDIVTAYRSSLGRSFRRARALPSNSILIEVRVEPGSPLAGTTLRDGRLPADTLVVSILREGETLFPRADSSVQPGDVLSLLTSPGGEPTLRAYLGGTASPERAG